MDIVKFISVAVMVFIHAHIVLVTDYYAIIDTSGFFYNVTSRFMFIGLFITILPMLAGYVFRMNNDYGLRKTIKLAAALSLLGFFMNMITWGAGYTFSWNILQLVSLSLVVIAVLMRFFSVYGVLLLGLFTIFGAEFLRSYLAVSGDNYLISIFTGADDHFVFWPFFPWFGVVSLGFLFADYQLKYKNSAPFRMSAMIGGMLLVAVAFFRGEISPYLDHYYVWSPSIFQPEIGFVLATIGLFLVLAVLGNSFFNKVRLHKYGIINSYSKGILWIYIVQMFVSYKLSFLMKKFFPMDEPSAAYFVFIIFMLGLSWLVGVLSIRLLQEKKMVILLRKIR